MPDGVLQWCDTASGDAEIARGGRRYRAQLSEIEPPARHPGARVHFDIHRAHGLETAVRVTLRQGTRVSPRQRRFGNLAGARRNDTKGPAPFARPHPDLGRALAVHPVEVAQRWATLLTGGDLAQAMLMYAPDAQLHIGGEQLMGRRHIEAALEASPLLGDGRLPDVRGIDGSLVVIWPADAEHPGHTATCRIDHGEIVEQWIDEGAPAGQPATAEGAAGPFPVAVTTQGEVGPEWTAYATGKLARLTHLTDEPVLFGRVNLLQQADPANPRPSVAKLSLDVNGAPVRAQVAARDTQEAIDLAERRLRDKIEHRSEQRQAVRRRPARSEAGEWRHGDLPAVRPEFYERPPEERQLVRHRTFAVDELTPDEAAFDLEQLDYDFYLFRDLASGTDCLIEHGPAGSYRIRHAAEAPEGAGPTAIRLEPAPEPTPELTVAAAIELLNDTDQPFVFFRNTATGRGNVVYRRYDGHYGLITPE